MSCKISDAGKCGEDVFSHSASIQQLERQDELTWVLRGFRNQYYDLLVCLSCQTEYMTSSIDNWAIGMVCKSGIVVSDFYANQTAAAFSNFPGQFMFESFTEGCENEITYEIGSISEKGQVPEGLTNEIVIENCSDSQEKTCVFVNSKA